MTRRLDPVEGPSIAIPFLFLPCQVIQPLASGSSNNQINLRNLRGKRNKKNNFRQIYT